MQLRSPTSAALNLAGIHVVSAVRPEYRSDYYVIGEKAIRAMLVERKAADEAATSNVRRRFEAISAKRDLSAEFRVIRRGRPDEDLTLSSLHSDLVVIGQRELQELKGCASPPKSSCSPAALPFSSYRATGNPSLSATRFDYWSAGTPAARPGERSQTRSPSL